MIILVRASRILVTRMIENKKRQHAEGSVLVVLHHPSVILVGRAGGFDFSMRAVIPDHPSQGLHHPSDSDDWEETKTVKRGGLGFGGFASSHCHPTVSLRGAGITAPSHCHPTVPGVERSTTKTSDMQIPMKVPLG